MLEFKRPIQRSFALPKMGVIWDRGALIDFAIVNSLLMRCLVRS
jgi:hypothetical protein